VVLVAILLLARVVEMRNIDKPRIFSLYLSRLQWLLASKTLHEKLWLQWLCYWHDICILLRGCLVVSHVLLEE
jgi:hypothetical protein